MAAKASAQITLYYIIDVKATYRYYLLQPSTAAKPSKPTTFPPSGLLFYFDGDVSKLEEFGLLSVYKMSDITVSTESELRSLELTIREGDYAGSMSFEYLLSDAGCTLSCIDNMMLVYDSNGDTNATPMIVFVTNDIKSDGITLTKGVYVAQGMMNDEFYVESIGYPQSSNVRWDDVEPSYTEGSTNSLYYVDCTVFADDSYKYSEVSLSSSYEAAKQAYNKAVNAQNSANNAQQDIDNLEIGGRNLLLNSDISYTVTGTGTAASYNSGGSSITYDVNFTELSKIPVGSYITISVYIKIENAVFGGSSSKRCGVEPSLVKESGTSKYVSAWLQGCENFEGRISNSIAIVENDIFTGTNAQPNLYIQGLVSGTVTVSHPKLEIGNKATAWTPAPEDVDDAINAKGEELGENITNQVEGAIQSGKDYTDEKLNGYVENDIFESYEKQTTARIESLGENVIIGIETVTKQITDVDGDLQEKWKMVDKHFTFGENGLEIGIKNNPYKTLIDNDHWALIVNGIEVLWFDASGKGHIPDLNITHQLNLLGLKFDKDNSGNLNCEYVGGDS